MSPLSRMPGWARRLDEHAGHFSEAGLGGLIDHHAVTDRLGKMLARCELPPGKLSEFLKEFAVPVPLPDASISSNEVFWTKAWSEILGRPFVVPPMPEVSGRTMEALGHFGLRIMFLPAITEADYPSDFVKPDWGRYLDVSQTERKPLAGRWVAVETIFKPDWDDPKDYGNGNDPLAVSLGLKSRFSTSWDNTSGLLPKAAKLLRVKKVQLPTAEEWNLIGNLFLWLNRHRNESLPDLGSTRSWEWCKNACGSVVRLIAGFVGDGGLAGVGRRWRGLRDSSIGFRVLAVL